MYFFRCHARHVAPAVPLWAAHYRRRGTRGVPQEDLESVRVAGRGRVDITVGSALDIFGGKLKYDDVVAWHKRQQQQQQQPQ